ncbi:MAG: sulfatase [Planctomycetota bacterium]
MTARPNILFFFSDDHAAHAISACGSTINQTPHIDRIAEGGVRVDRCFCTNSICTPSRATVLTGQYGHVNGVTTWECLDNRHDPQVQKLLQSAGYETGIFGKWHLGLGQGNCAHGRNLVSPSANAPTVPADPAGFDRWAVLPGQGDYHDPLFHTPDGEVHHTGYVSDIITDLSLAFLRERDTSRPFFLCVNHKAPHRPWEPGEKYAHLYEDEDIPLPETFWDDYATRPAAEAAKMRVARDMNERDLKAQPPAGLSDEAHARWCYQRYIKDYLRCVASIDASVGQLLDELDAQGLVEDTLVIYSSDQGFFLGDHGWYDKRFIYEESLRMPMMVRYPGHIPPGSRTEAMLTNTDFAPTLLEFAGVPIPGAMQGRSAADPLRGNTPDDWQQSIYYRYWNHGGHHVAAHYGVRTATHKLVFFYANPADAPFCSPEPVIEPYWELFDLERDPRELRNVYGDPAYADVQRGLITELERLQQQYGDQRLHA